MNYPKIEKPTEPGLYWFRQIGGWREVRVTSDGLCQNLTRTPHVDVLNGDWRGPIPEPAE